MLLGNLTGPRRFNLALNVNYSWLAVVDALLFFAVCYVAAWLYAISEPLSFSGLNAELPYRAALFAGMTTLGMHSMGLHQPRLRESVHGILLRTVVAFALMGLGMAVIMFLFPRLNSWTGVFLYAAGAAFVSSMVTREIFRSTVKLEQFNRRVLVLGTGRKASNISGRMRRKSDHHGFRICAYVRVPGEDSIIGNGNIVTLQQPLSEYVRNHNIEQVVVALDSALQNTLEEELMRCRMLGVPVVNILDFFEDEAGKVLVDEASPEWFIFARGFRRQFAGGIAKRAFDIGAGLFLLLLTWPVMLLTTLAIKLEDGAGAPVVFRQKRVGLNGRIFSVLKFRSMTVDAEADGKARWATANDARVTRVGQVIRKLRIDELPQIFNVLAGDMAFVGPRPERPEFVSELSEQIPYFDNRHGVKPGITGWAQLNYPYGASVIDARNKLEFDLYYVKNQSLYLDFLVLLRTVEVVVFGKGAK
ncbi:MAG: TIGR03013 family XrtA/PEP-CTERM system glycosyltransferase [Pseudohongiellaceae bacterium]